MTVNESTQKDGRRIVSLMSLRRDGDAAPRTTLYTVRPGDTLDSIAWMFYKNRGMKRTILAANDLATSVPAPGTTLRIPAVQAVAVPAFPGAAGRDRRAGKIHAVIESYTARGGESLEEIADIFYREPLFAHLVAAANDKPRHYTAKPGERLQVPFKIVEVRSGETVFSIAERETGLRNYFMKLMMINRNIRPVPGDRLRVPPLFQS